MPKSKNPFLLKTPSPPDFYKFQHRTTLHQCSKSNLAWTIPSWIVGVSPFDNEITSHSGYVIHTETPKILARWAIGDEINQISEDIKARGYHDEELEILLYEISHLDLTDKDSHTWLLEAVCAIAYSKGLICELEPPAEH